MGWGKPKIVTSVETKKEQTDDEKTKNAELITKARAEGLKPMIYADDSESAKKTCYE